MDSSLLNVCPMINLHSFRKSGSSISAAMCSVVGKNPGGGGGVVKPTATSLGPQEAKRLNRRSDAEAERDPESDNGDVGSEGSSSKGDKGRHALDRLAAGLLQNCALGEDVLLLLQVVSFFKATDFQHYIKISFH